MEKDESVTKSVPTIQDLLEDALDYISRASADLGAVQHELDNVEYMIDEIMQRLEKVSEGSK